MKKEIEGNRKETGEMREILWKQRYIIDLIRKYEKKLRKMFFILCINNFRRTRLKVLELAKLTIHAYGFSMVA